MTDEKTRLNYEATLLFEEIHQQFEDIHKQFNEVSEVEEKRWEEIQDEIEGCDEFIERDDVLHMADFWRISPVDLMYMERTVNEIWATVEKLQWKMKDLENLNG